MLCSLVGPIALLPGLGPRLKEVVARHNAEEMQRVAALQEAFAFSVGLFGCDGWARPCDVGQERGLCIVLITFLRYVCAALRLHCRWPDWQLDTQSLWDFHRWCLSEEVHGPTCCLQPM